MDRLAGLLLDFGRAPGNYLLRLREPRELFDEFDVVAQWALNRIPPNLQLQAEDLRAAAVLFIQRACFVPDCTHYQVLGLQQRDYPAEEVRARYRTMIRLAHPDMGVKGLPTNAASLVNRAHEVLTTPALRERYDEQLLSGQMGGATVVPPTAARPVSRVVEHQHGWQEQMHMLKAQHPKALRAALALGSVGVVVAGVLLWAAQETNDSSRMLIVARAPGSLPVQARPAGASPSDRHQLAMSHNLSVAQPSDDTRAVRDGVGTASKSMRANSSGAVSSAPAVASAPDRKHSLSQARTEDFVAQRVAMNAPAPAPAPAPMPVPTTP